jgi:hypothetical protein
MLLKLGLLCCLLIPLILKAEQNSFESKPVFAVIYRGFVKPGCEMQYQECWKIIASYFVKERGALGSTLHRAEDGMWVAYSRWPDKATRDASWPRDKENINSEFPLVIREAIIGLKQCLETERRLPEICMEIIEEISSD